MENCNVLLRIRYSQTFINTDRARLISCIGLALIFWLLIKLSKTFNSHSEVTIAYNIPAGKVLVEQPPSKVLATYTGMGWDLASHALRRQESNIVINLSNEANQTIYQSQIRSRIKDKLTSKSVQITALNYDYIPIQLEDEFVKKVPINLDYKFEFEGTHYFYQDSIQLSPDSITLTGPKAQIDSIEVWNSQKLMLKGINQSIQKELNLKVPQTPNIRITPELVKVNIPVEQFTERAVFVPITIKNAPDSLKIFPDKTKLNCVIGLSYYDQMTPEDFEVEVDLQGVVLNNEKNTLPLQLVKQPPYITNPNLNPKSVEFFILEENE